MSNTTKLRLERQPTRERDYSRFKKMLLERKQELESRIADRLERVSIATREPDDEGGLATESYTRDLNAAALDAERNTLREIQAALSRIETGDYGICENCGTPMPPARLEAIPWARYCVNCAARNAA
jgi:DnaK suppressor protein